MARFTSVDAIASVVCAALVVAFGLASLQPTNAYARRPSRKQLGEAEAYHKLAKERFGAKRYEEAADLFMKVYRLSKSVAAVFNAARCKEMGGKLAEARGLFELYLSISDNEDGKTDAREHIVSIAAQLEAKRKADDDARRQAEQAAKEAQAGRAKAEQRAAALEAQKKAAAVAAQKAAEKAAKDALARKAADDAARRKAAQQKLAGVCVLPPDGVQGGDLALQATAMLKAAHREAVAASVGKVHGVAAFNRFVSARGTAGACDFSCKLGIARSLGARWAIGTTVGRVGGGFSVKTVLWRTLDMGQDGTSSLEAATAADLTKLHDNAIGDIFNRIRIWPTNATAAAPIPAGAGQGAWVDIVSAPPGAQSWLDGKATKVSPLRVYLAPGWHRLQFALRGHRVRGGLIYVRNGVHLRVDSALPKLIVVAKPRTVAAAATQPAKPSQPAAKPGQTAPVATTPAQTTPGLTADGVMEPPRPVAGGQQPGQQPGEQPSDSGPAQTNPGQRNGANASNRKGDRRSGSGGTKATVDFPGTGWMLGGVVHFTGSVGGFEARSSTVSGGLDVSLGGGAFVQLGYASSSAPFVPWFTFLAGLRYAKWQGLYSESETSSASADPNVVDIYAGLAFPRAWGLRFAIHRHFVSKTQNDERDGYNAWSAGKTLKGDVFYLYAGLEGRLTSDRPIATDPFGQGPTTRVMFEFGVNFNGVRLSR